MYHRSRQAGWGSTFFQGLGLLALFVWVPGIFLLVESVGERSGDGQWAWFIVGGTTVAMVVITYLTAYVLGRDDGRLDERTKRD